MRRRRVLLVALVLLAACHRDPRHEGHAVGAEADRQLNDAASAHGADANGQAENRQ